MRSAACACIETLRYCLHVSIPLLRKPVSMVSNIWYRYPPIPRIRPESPSHESLACESSYCTVPWRSTKIDFRSDHVPNLICKPKKLVNVLIRRFSPKASVQMKLTTQSYSPLQQPQPMITDGCGPFCKLTVHRSTSPSRSRPACLAGQCFYL